MAGRIAAGQETRLASLDDLVARVVLNALGRERTRSLAWSQLMLHGGRSPTGRTLARCWYEQLDAIWHEIAGLIATGASRQAALPWTTPSKNRPSFIIPGPPAIDRLRSRSQPVEHSRCSRRMARLPIRHVSSMYLRLKAAAGRAN